MGERQHPHAVALKGHGNARAAHIVAKGYGELAEQIIAEARRHGIPVHDAPELVDLLMKLDLDEHIPGPVYEVVARLLAWLADIEQGETPGDR